MTATEQYRTTIQKKLTNWQCELFKTIILVKSVFYFMSLYNTSSILIINDTSMALPILIIILMNYCSCYSNTFHTVYLSKHENSRIFIMAVERVHVRLRKDRQGNATIKMIKEKNLAIKPTPDKASKPMGRTGPIKNSLTSRPGNSKAYIYPKVKFREIDIMIKMYYDEQAARNSIPTNAAIKKKALEFASQLEINDFQASNGWLHRFKIRHNLCCDKRGKQKTDRQTDKHLPSVVRKCEFTSNGCDLGKALEELSDSDRDVPTLKYVALAMSVVRNFYSHCSNSEQKLRILKTEFEDDLERIVRRKARARHIRLQSTVNITVGTCSAIIAVPT
ncbi:Tigger transposable element-derived protein 6 [Trichinella spiralis]|uniref:Tigger transposable element-derived protein 6 n=1 Tax=Trichinella spiralis TaxID=6334 RepID=A0A0V1BHG9_TRISP|nr:Tigger transposable element-derived protein 6 [Trichinella spiralis]